MKRAILIITILIIGTSLYGQDQRIDNWLISANAGIEAHDKRVFRLPDVAGLLGEQADYWGTYHRGVEIQRRIWQKQKISGYLGVGFSHERATFLRPFNQIYFGDTTKILLTANEFEKWQIPISLVGRYKINSNWFATAQLTSNIVVYRGIDHTGIYNPEKWLYSKKTNELDEVNLRFGINYAIRHFWIGVNSRLLNFQKIDKILFEGLRDFRDTRKWEWTNRPRFDFTIGFMF